MMPKVQCPMPEVQRRKGTGRNGNGSGRGLVFQGDLEFGQKRTVALQVADQSGIGGLVGRIQEAGGGLISNKNPGCLDTGCSACAKPLGISLQFLWRGG